MGMVGMGGMCPGVGLSGQVWDMHWVIPLTVTLLVFLRDHHHFYHLSCGNNYEGNILGESVP